MSSGVKAYWRINYCIGGSNDWHIKRAELRSLVFPAPGQVMTNLTSIFIFINRLNEIASINKKRSLL